MRSWGKNSYGSSILKKAFLGNPEYSDDNTNSSLDSFFHFRKDFRFNGSRTGTADKETFIKGCNLFTFG